MGTLSFLPAPLYDHQKICQKLNRVFDSQFNRAVEVYWLENGEYSLVSTATTDPIRPRAFPISIDPSVIWA